MPDSITELARDLVEKRKAIPSERLYGAHTVKIGGFEDLAIFGTPTELRYASIAANSAHRLASAYLEIEERERRLVEALKHMLEVSGKTAASHHRLIEHHGDFELCDASECKKTLRMILKASAEVESARGGTKFSFEQRRTVTMNTSMEMPRYRSHKEVWALKIKSVERKLPTVAELQEILEGHPDKESRIVGAVITPEDERYAAFEVDQSYVQKHDPKAGGYYVVYKDGYKSFSPAEAFEEGYTAI